jgi:hypothetical protein
MGMASKLEVSMKVFLTAEIQRIFSVQKSPNQKEPAKKSKKDRGGR